jgi:hypothetical protein
MALTMGEENLFFFECATCGTYRVSSVTAHQFVTSELGRKLDDKIAGGFVGAKLKFYNGCPKCAPNSTHEVELAALKRRIN